MDVLLYTMQGPRVGNQCVQKHASVAPPWFHEGQLKIDAGAFDVSETMMIQY